MKHRKKGLNIVNVAILLLLLACLSVLGYSGYKIYKSKSEMAKVIKTQNETSLPAEVEEKEDVWAYMDEYRAKKAENEDFVGWIKFDSGLINLPFMQNGDYYLRRNFHKEYDTCGTPYMNPQQTLDSQNITIYGHYVYIDEKAMFTPLDKLRFQENYEENKIFRLYLEDEIRTYQIAAVVDYNEYGDWLFDVSAYSTAEWQSFLDYARQHKLYETGVEITEDARYVTLQTCIRNRPEYRNVMVARQIEVLSRK